jgi:hypothetical protein
MHEETCKIVVSTLLMVPAMLVFIALLGLCLHAAGVDISTLKPEWRDIPSPAPGVTCREYVDFSGQPPTRWCSAGTTEDRRVLPVTE